MNCSIRVAGLGKKYKRYPHNWNRLCEWLTGGRYAGHQERWALRGLNFSVEAGQAVGIIGQNGAGKSTFLKLLTGTSQANEGSLQISGTLAALLELGMGFHPDFTGRENATMACRMMGLPPGEIRALLPAIESFSGLGDYLDQPLRVYSTGMQMRLAFSAATAVRRDILIIDEALSVGDAYFQHKCIERIRCFKEQGTTLLFVSHDPAAVKSLCDRAILLDQGRLIQDGAPEEILDYYNALIARKEGDEEIKQVESRHGRKSTRSGSRQAEILEIDILDDNGQPARAFQVGDMAQICCRILFHTPMQNPTLGILLRDRLGNDIFGTNTYYLQTPRQDYAAGEILHAVYKLRLNLGRGNYSLTLAVHALNTHLQDNRDWWDNCLVFQVIPNNFVFVGLAALPVEVEVRKELKEFTMGTDPRQP